MKRISKKTLIQVLSEMQTQKMPQTSYGDEAVNTSPSFQKKMASIFRKRRRRQAWKRIGKACAMFILGVLGTFVLMMSFSQTVRAEILKWYREVVGKQTYYYSNIEVKEGASVYKIAPTWLPEGVQLSREVWRTDTYYGIYDGTTGNSFILAVDFMDANGIMVVDSEEEREFTEITVKGRVFDCYISKYDNSDYIWADETNECYVILNSTFPHETNLKILESLFVEK